MRMFIVLVCLLLAGCADVCIPTGSEDVEVHATILTRGTTHLGMEFEAFGKHFLEDLELGRAGVAYYKDSSRVWLDITLVYCNWGDDLIITRGGKQVKRIDL